MTAVCILQKVGQIGFAYVKDAYDIIILDIDSDKSLNIMSGLKV